jgi:tetratricopeptide (TPR) repeat protein
MKLKYTAAIILVSIITFITVQSFYYRSKKKEITTGQSYFRSFPVNISLCVPPYNHSDSLVDIPALKGWGNYKWKISSASDSAQFYFNQGISMYYAFHSIEAIASFTKATHLDPNCAMAWYGKALAMGPTINYPNGYRPPSDALDAAVRSQKLSSNCTALEKDLINAIQQRYSADTTMSIKLLRINYANAMQLVYAKHPKNADAITLYADALLLLHPWDLYTYDFKSRPWTPKIQSLLEMAMVISPKHPGANHYYIHTMEESPTPGLAAKSAHLLDTLMPQVSHATHMPSHIYIRTGDYQRGIKNNDAAVAGYDAYIKQYAPVKNGFALYKAHNMHMKISCAQMAGNYKTSIDESRELQTQILPAYLTLKGADGNYMQYLYLEPILTAVRFGKWDDILKTPAIDTLVYISVLQHFARGMAFSRKSNIEMAKQELHLLNEKIRDKSLKYTMDNSNSVYATAVISRLILQGIIAEGQKQYGPAIEHLQKAVYAEDHLLYSEPRDWPLPARQYLANILIEAGKYDQAIATLKQDLVINPNNGWSLTGLQLAYKQTNNNIALRIVQSKIKSAWKIKDVTIQQPAF